jgi:enoyl-CoA hydratase/carnithine racemase
VPDVLSVEVAEGIAVLSINRPGQRNAVNEAVAAGIAAAFDELDPRRDVSAFVLTGAGGTFSAGMDLKGFLAGENPQAGGRGFGGITARLAMEIALTGDHVPARRLHEAGLVNRLVPPGQALPEARALAARIARNAPLALAASKRVMMESADWPTEAMFTRQDEIARPVFLSADAMEGAAAFAEKRSPVWRGE